MVSGPLELVQNNIMQLSEPLNNVIKSGQVAFKANSRHPSFNKYREHHSPENFYDSVQASPENALSPERFRDILVILCFSFETQLYVLLGLIIEFDVDE